MKIIANNILETSTSYGIGDIVLGGAVSGYYTFSSSVSDNIYTSYYIEHDTLNEWEAGIGVLQGGVLKRLNVRIGTNGREFVNFSAGIKQVSQSAGIELNINTGDTLITEGALIDSATSKTTPADADMIGLMDSAASNILKKLSWLNLKNALKTYFDTLYQTALGFTPENVSNKSSSYTASSTITYANTKALVDGLGTKQDTLVSGTNIKTINSTSILGSGNISTSGYDPLSEQIFFQDFVFDTSQGGTANYTFGTQAGSGQAGALLSHTYTNAVGVVRLTSGTSASTGLSLQTNPQQIGAFRPSTYAATFVGRINMNQLSNATNRYIIRIGLITAAYNSNPASGIFFRYSDNVNSGNYECVCRNANVETVINTTIAPAISTNWDKLEWRINAAGTSVEFFINNVSQGTIATNIPTTTYLLMWFVLHKVSGSSSQLMDIDAYYFKITRTI